MAKTYDPHGLFVLSYAGGFTSWFYRSRDDLETVSSPGYFDAASDMLRDGDRLSVNVVDRDGRTLEAQDFVVCRRRNRIAVAPLTQAVRPADAFDNRLAAVEAA